MANKEKNFISAVVYVHNAGKRIEKFLNVVIEEMQNAYAMRVPLTADSGFGNNWLEAH